MKGDKNRDLICWGKDTQAQAFRVELVNGIFIVTPYVHLVFVKFETKDDWDVLRIVTVAHDFQLIGKNLREIGLAFQKSAVDWVKELPSRFDPIEDDGQVWIKNIVINETERASFPNGNKTPHPDT